MLKHWKNRGTFAGQRGTIGWFRPGLPLEKLWHDAGATWHDSDG